VGRYLPTEQPVQVAEESASVYFPVGQFVQVSD